jgi:hypothetical protein
MGVSNEQIKTCGHVVLDILSPENVTEQGCAHGTRKINLGSKTQNIKILKVKINFGGPFYKIPKIYKKFSIFHYYYFFKKKINWRGWNPQG